jgi:hypothetical protein
MAEVPRGWFNEVRHGIEWITRLPAYRPPYAPPSMDAAENLKFLIWLVNHPDVPAPKPWRVNLFNTPLEDMVFDLPANPIPRDEVLDVPY